MSKNIIRSFPVKININTGEILEKPKIVYYNTDINTSYIYVELYKDNDTLVDNLSDYKAVMNIVKPNNVNDTLEGEILPLENKIIYKLPLKLILLDGAYKIEFFITDITSLEENRITSDEIKYKVKSSILSNTNEDVELDNNYPILLELIDDVKILQDKYLSKKELIFELVGTEENPILLNSLESNIYIIPKDSYYKFNENDVLNKCDDRKLLVLNKLGESDQLELISIDSKNIKEIIINNSTVTTSEYMHSSKILDYLIEMSTLDLNTLETTNKKLVGAINELSKGIKTVSDNAIKEERIKTLISENAINEEGVRNVILEMIKTGAISSSYSIITNANIQLNEI